MMMTFSWLCTKNSAAGRTAFRRSMAQSMDFNWLVNIGAHNGLNALPSAKLR
jgi:hypothetical protein